MAAPDQPVIDLTRRQLKVCLLHYGHGKDQKEIARRLKISQPAVSKHLRAARRRHPSLRRTPAGRRRTVSLMAA